MKTRLGFEVPHCVVNLTMTLALLGGAWAVAQTTGAPPRPQGPCDIYAAAGTPCVSADSTTRALYASYNGPLYQVMRQSDGKTLDIGVIPPVGSPVPDAGGYADAAAQDRFCANTYCWITTIYDQSPKHNDLTQAPRGNFSGPALGGLNNVPVADLAPVTIMGHKVYGVFIEPGMGLRNDNPKGTAVDDQAEGIYWVINGRHFNSGCCFDYGNAETDSHDDDNGTMETAYFGNAGAWFHGAAPGPWIMTDQENNLVGCVNADGSKTCPSLQTITWPFVTAIAKGEANHWTTLGGNAQQGQLAVLYNGPRVNSTYAPMRKQGAIDLGNGGDNSNGAQGTFYEGAMTAAGTFPTDATDQLVQANVVAAGYGVAALSLAPAAATAAPTGLQTFAPGTSQNTTVTFTNTAAVPAAGLSLSLAVPNPQWKAVVLGTGRQSAVFTHPVAPGASVSATFKVTSGRAALNGNLVSHAAWMVSGGKRSVTASEKVRNESPIRINEFRISADSPTNSFIELYNAGSQSADISNWSLTEHPAQQAIFSKVTIPAGTHLAAKGFYLLGLANSGLAVAAHAGDATIHVRNTTGMGVGDSVSIGTGSGAETGKIASLGTAAGNSTTVWQPLPEGPVTIPAGSTDVPVTSVAGFNVGEKIGIGYGTTSPAVSNATERYEVATITAVGKPGTQALLGAAAPAGATNIKVNSSANISVGDTITLDIDSVGHGIETVTVTHVGTPMVRTSLMGDASAGATTIEARSLNGFAVGDQLLIGAPAHRSTVTISALTPTVRTGGRAGFRPGGAGGSIAFTPALDQAHANGEEVQTLGTGLDLAAPLRFNHASNLPFSDRGTGISFEPATAFAHVSNEPVLPLGTGITLDRPLAKDHAIDAAVRDAAVTTAGYQGTPAPNQWFGGPELATTIVRFGNFTSSLRQGSMVLRDASGLVVDSLNYGAMVDPWAAEGYQGASGAGKSGCYAAAPGPAQGGFGRFGAAPAPTNTSAGRFPDGANSDSNCADFRTQHDAALASAAAAGATNVKVTSVAGLEAGETIRIGMGANLETAKIANVGTAGGTTVSGAVDAGATEIPVASAEGFRDGQVITLDGGADAETATIAAVRRGRPGTPMTVTVAAPLAHPHAAGVQVSGTGIRLGAALARAHASGAQVSDGEPTPGAPNRYH